VKFEYMDHHVIALFALIGMGLDLLGGLFLAYDLFGRRGGPLRTLLRAILYCFIFTAVCSIALDWRFAVVAGYPSDQPIWSWWLDFDELSA
jgi:hypothetical protein